MKRIASLLMLAARSTLWKAAGITLASCLTEAGLFLAALSGWQDTVRTAYYEYSNPMGLEGLLMQYPLSWCFRIGLVLVCAVLAFLGWEGSSRVSYTLRRLSGRLRLFLPVVLLGGPPGHPAGSLRRRPPPSGTGVLRPPGSVPGLLPRPLSPQPAAPG